MIIKLLNKLLHKYMWAYEREEGDRGIVIAKTRSDAIKELQRVYGDAEKRIAVSDAGDHCALEPDWMYLLDCHGDFTIDGNVFITEPWQNGELKYE